MSKLKVDELRSADRSVSSTANITLADNGNVSLGGTLSAGTIGTGVTQPARHNFLAYKDGYQTVGNATTVQVSFQTDAFSSWDGTYGFDISNDRYVVPETGVYYIYFSGRLTDGDDTSGGSIWKLTHNETLSGGTGTASIKNFGSLIKEASGYVPDTHAMRVISLTQGDYLRLYCRNMLSIFVLLEAVFHNQMALMFLSDHVVLVHKL